MTKISIALCTYNGAEFLSQQLESFLAQTRLPDELVVCDDCSQDESVKLVENFARRAGFPVRIYVNEENLRSTKNFEKAISLCTGDLIFLSDQDDIWRAAKIEHIVQEFDSNKNVGLVFSDADLIDERSEKTGERLWHYTFNDERQRRACRTEFFKTLLKGNSITGATMAFRSSFVPDFLPVPNHIPDTIHDYWIALVVSAKAEVSYLGEPLIAYRLHPRQQLGIGTPEKTDYTPRTTFQEKIEFYRKKNEWLAAFRSTWDWYPTIAGNEEMRKAVDELIIEWEENWIHLKNRQGVISSRSGRLSAVYRELKTGRYKRFSRGFLSAIKDLLKN